MPVARRPALSLESVLYSNRWRIGGRKKRARHLHPGRGWADGQNRARSRVGILSVCLSLLRLVCSRPDLPRVEKRRIDLSSPGANGATSAEQRPDGAATPGDRDRAPRSRLGGGRRRKEAPVRTNTETVRVNSRETGNSHPRSAYSHSRQRAVLGLCVFLFARTYSSLSTASVGRVGSDDLPVLSSA